MVKKFISIDAIRQKREQVIKDRNDCLLNCQYDKANKLLSELQVLNEEFNEMLKGK